MAKTRSKSKKGVKKKYQIEMTALSMSLWSFLLFFLLAWIFVLGIFVGRGFLPGAVTAISDLKGQISRLQEMVGRNHVRDLGGKKKSDPDPKLAFYEKLSSKRDEAKKQWQPETRAEETKKAALAREVDPERNGPPETGKKEPVESSEKPLEQPKGEAKYSVQLASLADRFKAEEMVDQMIDRGYDAYYYEARVKGKTYYRVRCGRFLSREEAGDYARKLAKEAGIEGLVSRLE
jgi:cell division septation protein DedD